MRGAPAIAIVAVLSLVAEVYERSFTSVSQFCELIEKQLNYLVTARPTAVNVADARGKLLQQLRRWTQDSQLSSDELKHRYTVIIIIIIIIIHTFLSRHKVATSEAAVLHDTKVTINLFDVTPLHFRLIVCVCHSFMAMEVVTSVLHSPCQTVTVSQVSSFVMC